MPLESIPKGWFKATVINMRYFEGSTFFGSFIHEKTFGLIWQIVFKVEYLFVKEGRIPLLRLIKNGEKLQVTIQVTIIFQNFV